MALMSRLDLEALFKNGKKPSEKDFAHLIESMLNKRDDQFMGRWKKGRTYRIGDVVIYNRGLWEVAEQEDPEIDEICGNEPPAKGKWQELIILESDGDWKIFKDDGVMYAQVYDLVGIGKEYDPANNDVPLAKLDIYEDKKGEYLIFPKEVNSPTLSLIQLDGGEDKPEQEKTYFLTGLDNEQVNFATDTNAYLFRKGIYCEDGDEGTLSAKNGDVLMTIRAGNGGLAQVGISTDNPAGMLDITDKTKGQFLFNPEDKQDPAFSIINLDPGTDKNYVAMGVGAQNTVFISDAPNGFVFRKGLEYNEYASHTDINQSGTGLMILLLDALNRTRLGIGTESPAALIDATDSTTTKFEVAPEHKSEVAIDLINNGTPSSEEYIAYGLGSNVNENNEQVAGEDGDNMSIFLTNAPGGYRFNQGLPYNEYLSKQYLDQGTTNVVFLADGKVGIGTEMPETRLEVTDHEKSGKFLFNLDDKAPNPAMSIINLRPNNDKVNYLSMGAGNKTSIFVTNSTFGYSFRKGGDIGETNNDVEIEQRSETLFSIRPESIDNQERIRPREIRMFPEAKGEVHISGTVGIEKIPEEYELDVEGKSRTITAYQVADRQKMINILDMPSVLGRLTNSNVRPVSFEWDPAHVKNAPQGRQFGFEGQSLTEVFHEVVRQTSQEHGELDTFSVAYQNMVPVLVKAIQELTQEVNALKQEVKSLKGS